MRAFALITIAALSTALPPNVYAQLAEPDPFAPPAAAPAPLIRGRAVPVPAPADAAKPAGGGKDDAAIDVPRPPAPPLGPKHIRLHLLDGSVIAGDLSVNEIGLETDFGKLVIPIDRIRNLRPGLDSYPKLAGEIEGLIKNLSSDDYKTREQAHKELAAMGVKVRKELERFAADENPETKRHIAEILKEFEEQAEDRTDDEDVAAELPWIRLDTVVTSSFTVLGRVSPKEFQVASKYGPLTVQLADVKFGERETAGREAVRKTVAVDGTNIAQRSFKSTDIRVQAGDKISFRADGSLIMSPWGNNASSTPDGAPNYGWYIPNQIPGGALIARIGDKGVAFKVGRQLNFVAKNSGVLQLAIAIQAQHASEGYAYPGQYNVKLRIDPK